MLLLFSDFEQSITSTILFFYFILFYSITYLKVWGWQDFLFLKEVSYVHQGCIYYNITSDIVKYYSLK